MPPHPHCHWRDLQEWSRLGLDMSTTSDDACKMFDAVLTQYVSYSNDVTIGGVSACMDRMLKADPDFLMGQVIKTAMAGKRVQSDAAFADDIDKLVDMSKQNDVTPWEQRHVEAIKLKTRGYNQLACSMWEDILVEYPLDMFALKLLYDTRAYEGNCIARRDCCGRVLPYWKKHMPLYGDLLSMYAFGLEETHFYPEAEKMAYQALEINPWCTYADHCIAHCNEMMSRTEEGKVFMEKSEGHWKDSTLACHFYWHWALFYFEDGEFDQAAHILQDYMSPYLRSTKSMPYVTDVSSLCFRLEAEGVSQILGIYLYKSQRYMTKTVAFYSQNYASFDVKQHWQDCNEAVKSHMDDRMWTFWDVHAMLSCVGSKDRDQGKQMIQGVRDYIRDGEGDIKDIYEDVSEPVMEAFVAYGEGEFERAIDIMKPLRYKLHRTGASEAQEWRDLGLPMSTVSDEACKMYDAALTQAVNHFDDETCGGLESCMVKTTQADPDFVMGHVMQLQMSGKKVRQDPAFAQEVYKLVEMTQKPHVTPWERQHATAVKLLTEGFTDRACNIWEDILVEYPNDMFAVRCAYEHHLFTGNSAGLKDCCSRIVPVWKKDTPLYGDLLGMYGFGLEEMNHYEQGEKAARQAIELNRFDAWANHCVAHCKEMTGQVKEGIKFMQDTENNWNDNHLLCHNYWHWALFLVEDGDFESAIGILDNHILPFLKKSKTSFSHSDAASLCFRLEAEDHTRGTASRVIWNTQPTGTDTRHQITHCGGYNVSDRWAQCYEHSKDQTDDYSWAFYSLHNIMSLTSAQKRPEADHLVEGIRRFIQEDISDAQPVFRDVVLPISEAFQAWDDKNYDRAVELMKPLRYKVYAVGGSNAQRDIFNIFAIHAALRSTKVENQKFARHLLLERKCVRGDTPLIHRLMDRSTD